MNLRRPARAWLSDACVTGIGLLLGLVLLQGAMETYPHGDQINVARDVVLGLVAGLALLLFRHRWPVQIALVLTTSIMFSSTAMGVGAMAVFTVASLRPWRISTTIALFNAVQVALVFLAVPGQTEAEYLQSTTGFVLGYAVLTVTGMLIRSRRQLIESLEERARQAEEGQRLRVEEARLLERERIAREMHDVLAHRISLLAVHAGALEFHADAPADQRDAAGVIRQSAYEVMEDLREVIGVLRVDIRDQDDAERPQPTLSDLPALVRESQRAGTHIVLDDQVDEPAAVPDRLGRHAYRIVQEGLTNARKHAPGAHVRITVRVPARAGLAIEIVNPLPLDPPAPAIPGAGAGLVGLRERVALLGGMLEHGWTAGDRFRLYAWLPFPVEKP